MKFRSNIHLRVIHYFLLLCIGAAIVIVGQVYATTAILVTTLADSNDGVCDADCSLREAVATAADGSEIRFADGLIGTLTLTQELVIGNRLTIIGQGSDVLIISGNDLTRLFRVDASGNLTLAQMTLTHAKQLESGSTAYLGGAIYNAGSLTLQQVKVTDNRGWNGAGVYNLGTLTITGSQLLRNTGSAGLAVYNEGGTVNVTDSALSNNFVLDLPAYMVTGQGGGILSIGGQVTLTNTQLDGNTIWFGVGVYARGNARIDMSGGSISGNISKGQSPVLHLEAGSVVNIADAVIENNVIASVNDGMMINNGGSLTITRTLIRKNSGANTGGAIFNRDGGQVEISGSTITGNVAKNSGGAIYNGGVNSNVKITDSKLSANEALEGSGGAIWNVDQAVLTIKNSVIGGEAVAEGNTSMGDGGGIRNAGGTVTISDGSKIMNNLGKRSNGGGLANGGWSGGIQGIITIDNSTVSFNRVTGSSSAAGIYNLGFYAGVRSQVYIRNGSVIANNISDYGCAGIRNSQGYMLIEDSSIVSNNTAGAGGGFCADYNAVSEIRNTQILNNGSVLGGGIYTTVNSDLKVFDSIVAGNESATYGGGIAMTTGEPITLTRVVVKDNLASGDGAGIWMEGGARLQLIDSYVMNNTSGGNGGGLYNEDDTIVTISGSTVRGNRALIGGGIYNAATQDSLQGTEILENGGGNCFGPIIDLGANSQYPDFSCGETIPIIVPEATITPTPSETVSHQETMGVYRPSTNMFYLASVNASVYADIYVSLSGLGMSPVTYRDVPVVGDWDGDGIDTVGFYRRGRASDGLGGGLFVLSNSNLTPHADYVFVLGNPSDTPLVGDWDGDGKDSVGVFRPTNGLIYLKNTLTTGYADFTMVLGNPGDVGIAGDWDNDGKDSPGVYRPSPSAPLFFLTNQVCNCLIGADYIGILGNPNDQPFTGDWDGNGRTGLGVFRTANGLTYLRNMPAGSGFADLNFVYGIDGDYAFSGVWGSASSGSSQMEIAPTFQP
ncbi:MAG: CSLREA domain-containing protein [Anaerolineae bacterium]|nr:CSLREA domain-containing protein [Anaerolineae bacterium]